MSAICELSIGEPLKGASFWAIPVTLAPPPRQGICVWETRVKDGKSWHTAFFTHTTSHPLTRHLSIALPGEYDVRVHVVSPHGRTFSRIHHISLPPEVPHD